MSDIHLSGFLFNASGAAISGATVEAFAKNTVTETGGTPVTGGSTTTNSSGYYSMTVTSDNEHDIRITSGNSVRWRRFDDRLQMEELEVSVLNIREGATAQVYTIAPGSISADRTLTLPAATGNDTLASLGLAQTFTAAQTFTGAVTVGSDGSGVDVIFYSGTAGDNMTWDASEELLTITGTNGQTALNVADGNVTIADNLTVSGNLTVTGTTTSVDSTTINAATAFVFEGATANCYETTLAITDPTADRTIYLPNQSGYLPVLASASTTQVGSTPEELNFLDGSAKSTSSITICDADAFIVIDGTTTKQIPASDITTYVGAGTMSSFQLEDDDGTEVAISNAKEVKIIGCGVTTNWTDTDNGTDGDPYDLTITVDAAQTGITSILATDVKIGEDDQTKIDFEDANTINFYANNAKDLVLSENSLTPGTSDGTALGTTSLMWSDLFLASGSVINFNNGDVTLTHSACTLTMAGGTLAAPTILATDIKIGEDDETKVDFACANIINLHANNIKALSVHNTSSKGELRFYEGANYVGFAAPALSADQVWALPTADGSCGQVLSTDGCGVLSWAAAGGVTGTGGTDNAILRASGTGGATLQNSAVTILDGGCLVMVATDKVVFDGGGDSDTYIYESAEDQLCFYTGNRRMMQVRSGNMFIGDSLASSPTNNGNSALTLMQGANDNEILSFHSTDVEHNTTCITCTYVFGMMKKSYASAGGLNIYGLTDGHASQATGIILTPILGIACNTTKTAAGVGILSVNAGKKAASGGGVANPGSNGNIFALRDLACGNAKFIVDQEGDIFYDGSASAYDSYCDAELTRTLAHTMQAASCEPSNIIKNKWDDFTSYNEQTLIDIGVLGGPVVGVDPHDRGLVSLTQLQRLHNGAIWQLHSKLNDQAEDITALKGQLQALQEGK